MDVRFGRRLRRSDLDADNQWVGRAAGVLPDSGAGSATYVLKYINDDNFVLQMHDRQVAGQPLADSETKYVRKAKP